MLTKHCLISWAIATHVIGLYLVPTWLLSADFLRLPIFIHQALSQHRTTSEKETTFTSDRSSGDDIHQKIVTIQDNVCSLRFVTYFLNSRDLQCW